MLVTNFITNVRFEIFTAVFTDVQIFRDVTSALFIPEDVNFKHLVS
jgi:hypothetical protein